MSRDLHAFRLGTTNEDGSRSFVYTADVKGYWHTRRNWVHAVLVVFFLVLPWLRYDGEQAVLIDVVHRRFVFLGNIFWAHDVPMMFLILASLFVTILFVTSVWGRIWCGWACPQTVFVDGIFRRIDRWVEGSHLDRRKRDLGPMNFDKFWRKSLKWSLFAVVAMVIAHSFMAYFAGARPLIEMMQRPPGQNWGYFLFVFGLEAILLFDFGWFREQFCVIMCPYGRLQSILMDSRSLTVLYDKARGEPRRGVAQKDEKVGDCVNCYRCVQVCPTGIDIRRGVQMECINCTACMDACDEIMTKVGKPTRLIRYESLKGRANQKRFSIRSLIYLSIIVVLMTTFSVIVYLRQALDVQFIRGHNAPFTMIKEDGDEWVMNHFQVQVSSQTREDVDVTFQVAPELEKQGVKLTTPFRPMPVKMGEIKRTELFIRFPKTLVRGGVGKLAVETFGKVTSQHEGAPEAISNTQEVRLVGPFM